ncbi:MAG: type IV pili twitching motility protein PilT [Acidobacteria bacterium]|nr:MAG: type IV pili twitching motility protein PilT [Acidobacteriota bacterium]
MKAPDDDLSRLVRELNASVGRQPAPETSGSEQEEASPPALSALAPAAPVRPSSTGPLAQPGLPRTAQSLPKDPAADPDGAPPGPGPAAASPSLEETGSSVFVIDSLRPSSERLDGILTRAVRLRASDVLLVAGFPPTARVHGELQSLGDEALTPADTRALSLLLLDDARYKEFQRERAVDFSFERAGGRFRCDLHHQRGSVALALRWLPRAVPSLDDLNLPPVIRRFTQISRGLVLFVGPTGCGKSTSLAALVEIINRTRTCHIVTIEDPIEYRHRAGRSVVEQIEIGRDAVSFARALRHCLRQDPDVILVGEMRDLETIATALTAAETGHLVFSTLHTGDAAQTVDRIIDAFPEQQQNQIRQQLSLCLAGIVVQNLVPTVDGRGRVPACEILIANDAIRNLIRTAKNHQIYSHLTMGRKEGMMAMEEALAELHRSGRISFEEALLRAAHVEEFKKILG